MSSSKLKGLLGVLLGLALIVVGFLTYKNSKQGNSVDGDTKHYKNTRGFEFSYPTSLFTMSENGNAVTLTSPYYTVQNFSGRGSESGSPIVPEASRFFFSIAMDMKEMDIEAAMDLDNPSFGPTYQQLKNKQTVDKSFLDTITVAKKTSYVFSLGAEGINMKYVYIPVSNKKTLVVQLKYIGDFLKDQIKPTPFSEKDQLKAFNDIMNDLEIK